MALTAALAPAAAHAVFFSAPSNFAAADGSRSVAVGNFNGDAHPDLAIANELSDNVSILLGDGSGSFSGPTNFAAGDVPRAVAVGNFDGNAFPDLAIANNISDNVSILLGDGSGSFSGPTNFAVDARPQSVAAGDFNGDSRPDLATAGSGFHTVSILLGDGSGGFSSPTNFAAGDGPFSVAVGHFNGDSRSDLAVANHRSDNVSILLGDGSGGFAAATSFAAGDYPFAVAVGDFNGDSRSDLATANANSFNVSILLGNGSGGFSAPTNFAVGNSPRSVAVGDFNADARPDLAVANFSDSVSILVGDGSGGFNPSANFAAGDGPSSVAVGNLNGDARPDLATANNNSDNVSVLLNTTSYPRPRGASPARFQLVPAYNQCTSPNRVHGPPDFPGNGTNPDGSCNPPAQTSPNLTVGNPNANFTGFVLLSTLVGIPGGPDDADVSITVKITDVRCQAGVSTCGPANTAGGDDYTGEVQASVDLRITDKYNGAAPGGGTDPATGDKTFDVTVPCGATATPTSIGSTCELTTTADALYGDSSTVKEGARAIWQVGQVDVYDGGADGSVATTADNTLFLKPGIFVP